MLFERFWKRRWRPEAYELKTKYLDSGIQLPAPCCHWCDARLQAIERSVEELTRLTEKINAGLESSVGQARKLELDAAMRLLEVATSIDPRSKWWLLDSQGLAEAFSIFHQTVRDAVGKRRVPDGRSTVSSEQGASWTARYSNRNGTVKIN